MKNIINKTFSYLLGILLLIIIYLVYKEGKSPLWLTIFAFIFFGAGLLITLLTDLKIINEPKVEDLSESTLKKIKAYKSIFINSSTIMGISVFFILCYKWFDKSLNTYTAEDFILIILCAIIVTILMSVFRIWNPKL